MSSVESTTLPTIHFILCDIEGTTSDIAFVKDVLFPFATEHLPHFIRSSRNRDDVKAQLVLAAEEGGLNSTHEEEIIQLLLNWIKTDRKATPLKTLQGMVWRQGYEEGTLKGHLYPDAHECLTRWQDQGLTLGVYSSGSVAAQILLFKHSKYGDLSSLFSAHFDTHIGHKREAQSYMEIIRHLTHQKMIKSPENLLFLSDVVEELDAANSAGMLTCELRRDQLASSPHHPSVRSFTELNTYFHFLSAPSHGEDQS